MNKPLSHGAHRCLTFIRRSRRVKGGGYTVGEKRLARHLQRSLSSVKRYIRELRDHGLLTVRRPPRRPSGTTKTGWRTDGFNVYRLTPVATETTHNRRSRRGITHGPSPTSWGGSAGASARADSPVDPSQRIPPDPARIAAMIAAVLAADRAEDMAT